MSISNDQPSLDHQAPQLVNDIVNGGLTPKRLKPITENSEYAAFLRRILRLQSPRLTQARPARVSRAP